MVYPRRHNHQTITKEEIGKINMAIPDISKIKVHMMDSLPIAEATHGPLTPAQSVGGMQTIGSSCRSIVDWYIQFLGGNPDFKLTPEAMENQARNLKQASKWLGKIYYAQTGKELSVF
jgi:hypothetical protein